ncbi:hypothetical protein BSKO_00626 [Bryopsis sp. KO-2023]|nr:hypothetical protein BSKO_00626 [Bryopsis sp. KO-2023]
MKWRFANSGVICLALAVCFTTAAGIESSDCRELGFTGSQACSDCARLEEYVKDQELVADCRKCCTHERSRDDTEKFSTAVLEVCQWNIGGFPHIKGFVSDKADDFPGLSVRFKLGAAPRLILSSKDKKEKIRIDHWKTEDIEEYLKARLDTADGS